MRPSLFVLALAMTPSLLAEGRSFNFSVTNPAPEVIATVRMKSAGSDWAEPGKEAAVVTISLDSGMRQHLMLFAGPEPYDYKIFLGPMVSGLHTLDVSRNLMSASEAEVEVVSAEFKEVPAGDPYYPILAFAPVVFARANTIGKFTDIPLILYCERLMEAGLTVLQY